MLKSCVENLPTVSIILPAKNEAAYIGKCLSAINEFNYPRHLIEVVVVDNGSTDDTAPEAIRHDARLVMKQGGYVGAVRNTGAIQTSGEILIFIDADCLAGKEYVLAVVAALQNQEIGAVGGGCTAPSNGTWVEKTWGAGGTPCDRTVKVLAASSFSIRRDVFDNVGGFNEAITAGEDDELSNRLSASGYKLISLKDCWVVHLGYPKTLMAVAMRQLWHGTHQIQSAKNIYDKMLLLSHLYLAGILLMLIAAVSDLRGVVLGAAVLILLLIPVMLSLKKVKDHGQVKHRTMRLFSLVPVYIFYMIGRAVGLLRNYTSILFVSAHRVVR